MLKRPGKLNIACWKIHPFSIGTLHLHSFMVDFPPPAMLVDPGVCNFTKLLVGCAKNPQMELQDLHL